MMVFLHASPTVLPIWETITATLRTITTLYAHFVILVARNAMEISITTAWNVSKVTIYMGVVVIVAMEDVFPARLVGIIIAEDVSLDISWMMTELVFRTATKDISQTNGITIQTLTTPYALHAIHHVDSAMESF